MVFTVVSEVLIVSNDQNENSKPLSLFHTTLQNFLCGENTLDFNVSHLHEIRTLLIICIVSTYTTDIHRSNNYCTFPGFEVLGHLKHLDH